MYDVNKYDVEENRRMVALKNEIAISNLVSIANNPIIMGSMEEKTRQELIKVLCSYTKVNMDEILRGDIGDYNHIEFDNEASGIRANIK